MGYSDLMLRLPVWLGRTFSGFGSTYATLEDRMRLVIELARQNVAHNTGGPFGAAIFDIRNGKLLAPGVNMVVASNCSVAHAEIIAIMIAQRKAGTYDLGAEMSPPCELVTTCEPCAMCLGAIGWSGVRRLICGAREEDAQRLGFDEGVKPREWREGFAARQIEVVEGVCRDEALKVMDEYAAAGGVIYNPQRGGRTTKRGL